MIKTKKTKPVKEEEPKVEAKTVDVKADIIENLKNFENAAKAVSKALKFLRAEAGLTQAQLSKESGVSVRSIRRYESGDPSMTINTLVKLFDSLGFFCKC